MVPYHRPLPRVTVGACQWSSQCYCLSKEASWAPVAFLISSCSVFVLPGTQIPEEKQVSLPFWWCWHMYSTDLLRLWSLLPRSKNISSTFLKVVLIASVIIIHADLCRRTGSLCSEPILRDLNTYSVISDDSVWSECILRYQSRFSAIWADFVWSKRVPGDLSGYCIIWADSARSKPVLCALW